MKKLALASALTVFAGYVLGAIAYVTYVGISLYEWEDDV